MHRDNFLKCEMTIAMLGNYKMILSVSVTKEKQF